MVNRITIKKASSRKAGSGAAAGQGADSLEVAHSTENTNGRIPLARPAIEDSDISAAERALRSGWLVIGPENQVFERQLAELTGRAHALCVSSGTSALELALWALAERDADCGRVTHGDLHEREVIVPAAGFPAAANAVARLGTRLVAVDIDCDTWLMDEQALAEAVTERTWAVISVDTFGVVADSRSLLELGRQTGAHIIDDAACSLGGFGADGAAGGGYGAIATFSFHPRKLITTGEGGALVGDDPHLFDCLRQLRNQGQAGRGSFARPGTNARLSEIAAAIGSSQLQRLHGLLSERRLLVEGYHERLARARADGHLTWQTWPDGARPAHQTFAVILGQELPSRRDRQAVQEYLHARDIETGVASFALNRLALSRRLPDVSECAFPMAEALHERGLALPLYPGMRSAELDRVTEALLEAIS